MQIANNIQDNNEGIALASRTIILRGLNKTSVSHLSKEHKRLLKKLK